MNSREGFRERVNRHVNRIFEKKAENISWGPLNVPNIEFWGCQYVKNVFLQLKYANVIASDKA